MIDFVKFRPYQPGFASILRNHPALKWVDHCDKQGHQTGLRATHHALTWVLFDSGFVEVTGSLHKCWNSLNERDAANWNDFRRLDLFDLLNWLRDEMGVDLHTATLHRVEFGVNLILPPAPPTVRDLLTRLLFYGKGHPFVDIPVDRGYYKRVDSSDFYVKAYDKGTQYDTPDQRLRFEKGVTTMKDINPPGKPPLLKTLAHLTEPARLNQLGTLLLASFDKCFWAEDFDHAALTATQRKTISQAHKVTMWATLTRKQRHRLRDDYNRIADQLNHRLSNDLRGQISTKWAELLEVEGNVLRRGVRERFTRSDKGVKRYSDSTLNSPITNPVDLNREKANNCDITATECAETAPKRKQNQGHKHRPTATDLRANPSLLAEVERGRKPYAKGSKDRQEERAAHWLRNDDSNPRNNLKRSINKIYRQPVLFDVSGLVRLNDGQQRQLGH